MPKRRRRTTRHLPPTPSLVYFVFGRGSLYCIKYSIRKHTSRAVEIQLEHYFFEPSQNPFLPSLSIPHDGKKEPPITQRNFPPHSFLRIAQIFYVDHTQLYPVPGTRTYFEPVLDQTRQKTSCHSMMPTFKTEHAYCLALFRPPLAIIGMRSHY